MNNDLDQLNGFRAEVAEPADERLNRIRFRMINTAAPEPRRSTKRFLVPSVAAAGVLAVAVGAVVIFGGAGTAPTTQDNQPAAAKPKPTAPATSTHEAAVRLLEGFADHAGSGPAPMVVADGKLLYVKGTGMADNSTGEPGGKMTTKRQTYKHEMWLSPNGFDPVKIVRTDDGQAEDMPLGKDNEQHHPASLTHPTSEFLAQLPTDPDQLLSLLTKEFDNTSAKGGSPDYRVVDNLRDVLYRTEPTLTPQLRAALYRAIAKIGSITSTGQTTTVDGHEVDVVSVSQTIDGKQWRSDLLLDPKTGRPVGSRSYFGDDLAKGQPSFYDLWSYAVVDKAGATR